jgi:diguanylate cyclase (GGDEF)-like protein
MQQDSTTGVPPAPSRLLFDRMWLFTALLGAIGAALLAAVWDVTSSPAVRVEWWVLALVFAALEPFHVPVTFRRSAESITLRELPLAFGFLVASPRVVVVASVIGPIVALIVTSERRNPIRVAFNSAQYLLNAAAGAVVYHALAGNTSIDRPISWAGAGAGAVVSSVLSLVLVLGAIWVSEGRPPRIFSATTALVAVAAALMNSSLGALIAVMIHDKPAALTLFSLPIVGCAFAYKAFVSSRANRADLTFLHESAQAVSVGGGELHQATTRVVERLCTSVGADLGEVWLFDEEGALRRWVAVGSSPPVTLLLSVLDEVVRHGGVALDRRKDRGAVANTLSFARDLGLVSGVVHPLIHDATPLGLVVIGAQGTGGSFRGGHGDLVPVFARQLAIRLASNRLGEAVDELARQRNELAVRASQDVLTGLANRMLFFSTLEELIRKGRTVTVAFIDLDDFKSVNDTHGHGAGDRVLQNVARCLKASFRVGDVVARLGGDEFAVLAVDTAEQATRVAATRAVEMIAQPLEMDGSRVRIGVSVGVAGHAGDESAGMLLARADAALYRAKRAGKGCVMVADDTAPYEGLHALEHGPRRS